MVYIVVEVEIVPPEVVAVITIMHDDVHLSHSMIHTSFPEPSHMHDSIYLHAPQIDKMRNISLSSLSPSFACIHILHVDSHRLGICGTMVHYRKLMGSVPQIADNFRSHGKYPCCVHPHDIECTKGLRDVLSPS